MQMPNCAVYSVLNRRENDDRGQQATRGVYQHNPHVDQPHASTRSRAGDGYAQGKVEAKAELMRLAKLVDEENKKPRLNEALLDKLAEIVEWWDTWTSADAEAACKMGDPDIEGARELIATIRRKL